MKPGYRHARPIRLGHPQRYRPATSRGFSLLEAMVAMVIIAIGLFGFASLQTQLQFSEIDTYQRAEALLLLQDMSDRMLSNRDNAAAYVTGASYPLGPDDSEPLDCSGLTTHPMQELDTCEWSASLKGSSVSAESGALAGAMVGARGCIEDIGNNSYLITVVWQGLTPLNTPLQGAGCGAGLYDGGDGSSCTNDICRRALSTVVRIGTL